MVEKIQIRRDYVLQYMVNKDLSLNQLALEIGISPATLSRVLNGERRPGQLVIGKMLYYFDMRFEDLFYYDFVDKSQR
ncbi:helix-turn-helix family protein [Bacillus atrophaeus subsp. globigii]|uniref:YvzC n=3 Tax=Bacillaceae TaxID=186817 RepID=A0ABM5M158_BACA1|nr:YvzC [Bacillus atrophaeus 1942]AIK46744.1 helix-turn-helix family protein [Bacillus atrophaeus subsp. globigii]AMR61423.1 transcriptional regulator [Bacillus subtilis subsp. globigii]ARW08325.1 putative HTH-type transcriptional regulator YvzC [Bacillus atrophaeus]EIM10782.1 YvzC protein [Bacillus atrophaeus C89]